VIPFSLFYCPKEHIMAAEHKNITDPNNHEPKGASTAVVDTAYVSDGAGSGTWKTPVFDTSGLTFTTESLLNSESTAATQNPVGLDTPLQIEFGPDQNTSEDPVSLTADGTITVNETGEYNIKTSLVYGRSAGTGVSILYIRTLFSGIQIASPFGACVDSADICIPYSEAGAGIIPAGTEITFEIIRDSAGNNDGGLVQSTATPVGWGSAPTARILISRVVVS
jgi:hypothetical protein